MKPQTLPPPRFAGRYGMPSLGAAEGRHGNPQGGFQTHPTLRVVRACHARGFTLVELLVVVVILAILGGMVSGALIVARSSAREAATRATIAKLHNIIMAKYESYRTRRVPLSDTDTYNIAVNRFGYSGSQPVPPQWAALVRLAALRDLMRMEMPERSSDLFNQDGSGNPISTRGPVYFYLPNPPSLLQVYVSQVGTRWATADQRGQTQAECLYMIVMACGEDARRQFHENEIGDVNGNGLREFVDGWGHPIRFLRWAPGFNDSDLQANVVSDADLAGTTAGHETDAWTTNSVLTARRTAAQQDHDPFDPRRVCMEVTGESPAVPRGWRLVPLIYSAGPDGAYGIAVDNASGGGIYAWSGLNDPYGAGWGIPNRIDNVWVHFDNIHNHMNLTEAR